jgi:hypothetical protein
VDLFGYYPDEAETVVINMIVDTVAKVKGGVLIPRSGFPWVLYILAHGANKERSKDNNKLKDLVWDVLEEFKNLEYLDCAINLEYGEGWTYHHGCFIVAIWP